MLLAPQLRAPETFRRTKSDEVYFVGYNKSYNKPLSATPEFWMPAYQWNQMPD